MEQLDRSDLTNSMDVASLEMSTQGGEQPAIAASPMVGHIQEFQLLPKDGGFQNFFFLFSLLCLCSVSSPLTNQGGSRLAKFMRRNSTSLALLPVHTHSAPSRMHHLEIHSPSLVSLNLHQCTNIGNLEGKCNQQ